MIMNTIWKGVLGVALVAAVGSGAAIGTSTYMMKHQQYAVSGDSISNVFSQLKIQTLRLRLRVLYME